MRMKRYIFTLLWLTSLGSVSKAGPKEDFVAEVEKQCKISKDDASQFANPGREGNVMQFKLCTSDTITVSERCTIKCVKAGGSL